MATIPRDIIDNLTLALNNLSLGSRKAIENLLRGIEYNSIEELRQILIDRLEPLFEASTDNAAAYAAWMYDEIREAMIGKRINAVAYSNRNPEATEGAIRAFVGQVDTKGQDRLIKLLCDRIDYEIKKAAAECIFHNGSMDPAKPKYARVPTGLETCEFCIMLASRGFVYHSTKSAGALDHYHPNCDCRVVPGFGDTVIPGYDPDALYRKWKDSGFNPDNSENRVRSSYYSEGQFSNFNDVKEYLYSSKSKNELNEKIKVLGSLYGYQSDQMQSLSMRNVIKTIKKKLNK